jgi:REP element-mobilizing transposase RayT
MRKRRLKIEDGCYHVVSRISGKRFLIDDTEKRILLGMMRAAAEFSGVEIYTYAIMTNHFHLLVRVPRKEEVSDGELERRIYALYGEARAEKLFEKWAKWEKHGAIDKVEDEKRRLRARMFDISQFCKTFKETYTQDYNRRTGNTGTIWEGRFKSNLIEPSRRALAAVAAYIHLNPVRAGMVKQPDEAGWTGFGAGCTGSRAARDGLCSMLFALCGKSLEWTQARAAFTKLHDGILSRDTGGSPNASFATANDANPALRSLLLRRTAAFLHGDALGSRQFLEKVARILPPRAHCRAQGAFDSCGDIGFSSASGVRETNISA